MATSFVIACPECKKQMKVTDALVGKKIRCKECDAVFPVLAPKAAVPAKPQQGKTPAGKPTAEKPPAGDEPIKLQLDLGGDDDDEGGGGNAASPYVLEATDDHIPRCPFCAKEMESADAIICLHCGYNTQTRIRSDTRKVHENTGVEIFMWLLPGIIGALVLIGIIVFDVLLWVKINDWAQSWDWLQNEDKTFWLRPKIFSLYATVFFFLIGVPIGRLTVKRLFINNKPTERELEKESEVEEEEE